MGKATWSVWFKVDDAFWSHPKVIAAGNGAIGLWARCGAWSAQHLTDGLIPASLAKQIGTAGQAAKLVDAGLWEPVDNPCGYLMHDWPDYQPTKQTTREMREKNADRQRTWRANHQVNGTRNAVTNSAPTRPVPIEADVRSPAVGRHARTSDDENRELATKTATESRAERIAAEGTP